jgi:predicted component of type VI protein secretion system
MNVKLRILHGKLQKKQGGSAGQDVKIRGPKFVIGSGPDCTMCCKSSTVSLHHCEIRTEKRGAVVRDLNSEAGTFVNDEPVEKERALEAGDILRVGRLEFEVIVDKSVAVEKPKEPPEGKPRRKRVGERVAKFIEDADEKERLRRLQDPESRVMHLDQIIAEAAEAAPEEEEEPEEPVEEEPKKKKKPPKKKPGKLPPKPPLITDNSSEAAEELLRRLLKGS